MLWGRPLARGPQGRPPNAPSSSAVGAQGRCSSASIALLLLLPRPPPLVRVAAATTSLLRPQLAGRRGRGGGGPEAATKKGGITTTLRLPRPPPPLGSTASKRGGLGRTRSDGECAHDSIDAALSPPIDEGGVAEVLRRALPAPSPLLLLGPPEAPHLRLEPHHLGFKGAHPLRRSGELGCGSCGALAVAGGMRSGTLKRSVVGCNCAGVAQGTLKTRPVRGGIRQRRFELGNAGVRAL